MATSTQSTLFRNLTYTDNIKDEIIVSGGTVVFVKDNVLIASEISEAQYRELLRSPFIDKIDVLPLKRFANEGIKYNQNTSGSSGYSGSSGITI